MAKDKTLLLVGAAALVGYALYSSSQEKKKAPPQGSGGTPPQGGSTGDVVKVVSDDLASFGRSVAGLFGGGSGTSSSGASGAPKNVTNASDPYAGGYVQQGSGGETNDQYFGDESNFGE